MYIRTYMHAVTVTVHSTPLVQQPRNDYRLQYTYVGQMYMYVCISPNQNSVAMEMKTNNNRLHINIISVYIRTNSLSIIGFRGGAPTWAR